MRRCGSTSRRANNFCARVKGTTTCNPWSRTWPEKVDRGRCAPYAAALQVCLERVRVQLRAVVRRQIETQPWAERSFYCSDPFGNKLCFVDDRTLFMAGLL